MELNEYVERKHNEHLTDLYEFLRIPSVSAQADHKQDVERAAQWVADRLRRVGLDAVLVDRECDETLQTIEFANLQLLEFRHIDNRLAIRPRDGNGPTQTQLHGISKAHRYALSKSRARASAPSRFLAQPCYVAATAATPSLHQGEVSEWSKERDWKSRTC